MGKIHDKKVFLIKNIIAINSKNKYIIFMNNTGTHESNEMIRKDAAEKCPPGFFQKLSAVLTVALAADSLLFFALTIYLYPLFHRKGVYLRAPLIKVLEIVPIIAIEYVPIIFFLYTLFLWKRALDEGRMPWFFRMQTWGRVVIIVVLASVTALAYSRFSAVMSHPSLSKVGPGYPILQKVQDIMIFLIITPTVFFQSLVWLWWFNCAVKRVRVLLMGLCAWFIYDSIVMTVLEDAIQKNPFSDITRHLHDSIIMDVKIGIAALIVFIVIEKVVLKDKDLRQRIIWV